jgi:ATP-dependent Lhr-like helicase
MRRAATMAWQSSGSERMGSQSQAFDRLHPLVQRWIYDQGWTELRDAQERAIAPILEGSTDVIIGAATAAGKTEAAFLPICSRMLDSKSERASVLYISPLKALINDQSDRMERLCETLEIEVHPWHGDIAQSRKREFLKAPSGILLITPESLESIFVNRGYSAPSLFGSLICVVVDELHSFMGVERGMQLQSLLRRVGLSIGRRVPRIALSATLGDMAAAAEFLRPGEGSTVNIIVSEAKGQGLKLLVRGYRMSAKVNSPEADEQEEEEPNDGSERAVAEDLFRTLRGSNNLVFANSRANVEKYTDLLTRISERERLPNEFWAHHGNLSKELREDAEAALKDGARPATAICTSTLELGIDVGAVKSVAQIGTPHSVAGLRQRLGRAGRRGEPAILRIYIREREIDEDTLLEDRLRFELVQTMAMVDLLLARWCEPPDRSRLHLSTLVQQILSLIAQHGGVTAKSAWSVLSEVFSVDRDTFVAVLRSLGKREILRQDADGTLLLDEGGERLVNHHSFYAAFASPEEFRLVNGSKTLGTLPIDRPLAENSFLIFGGRRWRVLGVDGRRKVIEVCPAAGGRVPKFSGDGGDIHDRVRQEMRAVYCDNNVPKYLDATARSLLGEARLQFSKCNLETRQIVDCGAESVVFTWMGDRITDTVRLMLARMDLISQTDGPCIHVCARALDTRNALEKIASDSLPDPLALAAEVKNKWSEKYDWALDPELLNAEYASRKLNVSGAHAIISQLAGE